MVYFITLSSAPCPPQTPTSTVQQYGQDSVNLTVQWQAPQCNSMAPVDYNITFSPGLNSVTTSETSVPVTVPYNVRHIVSIVAANCRGSSSAAMETIRIGIYPYVNCMYACFASGEQFVGKTCTCMTVAFYVQCSSRCIMS